MCHADTNVGVFPAAREITHNTEICCFRSQIHGLPLLTKPHCTLKVETTAGTFVTRMKHPV